VAWDYNIGHGAPPRTRSRYCLVYVQEYRALSEDQLDTQSAIFLRDW